MVNIHDNASMQAQYLNNHLLIAMPQMHDASFEKTVTLICEHNEQGALGIVLNRPLSINIGDILEQFDLDCIADVADEPTLMGGPVATERGFILHTTDNYDKNTIHWESSLQVSENIHVTSSQDILEAIASGHGPKKLYFALGYSGWDAGQLEEELKANAWLIAPAKEEIIFTLPFEQRWRAAANSIGVDLDKLSTHYGHA